MQNDIRLHLAKNEQQQSDIESTLAKQLQTRFEQNVRAFVRHIPSIGEKIQKQGLQNHSIFVDKHAQTNIVNVGRGSSFYHFNVDDDIKKQCETLYAHSALIDINQRQKADAHIQSFDDYLRFIHQNQTQLTQVSADTVVIFGVGKGAHIAPLIDALAGNSAASKIVIYEENWEYFYCSLFCCSWAQILEDCAQRSISLFLQLENNAASLNSDLAELRSVCDIRHILFFKHYNSTNFDYYMQQLRQGNNEVLFHPLPDLGELGFENYVAPWTPAFLPEQWQAVSADNEHLQKNLQAFATYFPSIADTFEDYEYRAWQPIQHIHSGQINLFNIKSCSVLTIEQASDYGQSIARHFIQYPNQDGLIFGYESPKLKHYLHNTFIRRASTVLKHQKDDKGELASQIKSLILFGLESGYSFAALLESVEVDNLFVCEPNPDFFYASLFAIDWAGILKHIDESEKRIYLNVGEAGSALYSDINSQFLAAGPHLLADTYFFQGYENAMLTSAVRDLREQLQVTFSLSENFDHALYGIEHTKHALQHKVPAMAAKPHQLISKATRQLPLFIVGNGPSLDGSIEALKEHRENIIVVSCGTALQALHSYGVTPDFHAEVEQCRATFDWASRINDTQYLKKITLVSVNGIHPDTSSIYKNTLFAFKAGESSTASATSMLGIDKFAMLGKAYPTVTNLAVNFFLELGFTQLYLLGVDLGFVDYNKHHSSQSGYFENGKQVYDYQENLAKSMPVKGNFRELVYTKAEFNISRLMMEQVLCDYKADIYNLSDGVFVRGTHPLQADDVLIANNDIVRQKLHEDVRNAFIILDTDAEKMYKAAFNQNILNEQIKRLEIICAQQIVSKEDVETLIENCRELIADNFAKGRSLFVYYFYGSLNYLCATLGKALMSADQDQAIENAQRVLLYWHRLVEDAKLMLNHGGYLLDTSASFSEKREAPLCKTLSATLTVYSPALANYLTLSDISPQYILATELPRPEKSLSCIVVLTNEQELSECEAQFTATWQTQLAACEQANVLIVYTDAVLFPLLHARFSEGLPKQICMVYMPFWPGASAGTEQNTALNPSIPLIEREEAMQFLFARLKDANTFSHILFKARFDEIGLIRAFDKKEDEYSSEAVDYLALHFSALKQAQHVSTQQVFSFNRYIGVSKEHTSQPSLEDAMHNRGLLLHRAIEAYELLGEWYKTPEAEAIRSHLQEHAHSV
jgi:hypothetical protein